MPKILNLRFVYVWLILTAVYLFLSFNSILVEGTNYEQLYNQITGVIGLFVPIGFKNFIFVLGLPTLLVDWSQHPLNVVALILFVPLAVFILNRHNFTGWKKLILNLIILVATTFLFDIIIFECYASLEIATTGRAQCALEGWPTL